MQPSTVENGWEIVRIWIFKSPLIAVIKCKRICSTVLVFDCSVFHSDHFGRRTAFSWLLQKSCSPSQAPCFFNMSSLPASITCLPCPQQRTGSTGAAGKRCARLSAPSYLWYFKISASFYSCPRHIDIVAQWVVFFMAGSIKPVAANDHCLLFPPSVLPSPGALHPALQTH